MYVIWSLAGKIIDFKLLNSIVDSEVEGGKTLRSSYKEEDVILLLKDITGLVEPQPTKERERLIQSGKHYSEMLPIEYVPTEKYMETYYEALKVYSEPVARAVGVVADKIVNAKGKDVVLVSLARAGIPIGILIKRYIKFKYDIDVPHYSISIIRGRGIDDNAMKYLLERCEAKQLLFVDGWIGKGAILNELKKDIVQYDGVSDDIAVIADPANVTELCGTHDDILIPSSCLNSTVSGLISRTFLRSDIIGENDFHGAVYYGELKDADLSYQFIETIESYFVIDNKEKTENKGNIKGIDEVRKIAVKFGVDDINFIKPGIGEATRVLLRRVPWKVLINEKYKGAQNPKYIYKPSFDFIKDYTDIIKVISYSPEEDKDFEFTKQVKKETDIVLSICHSDASYSTGKEAKDLGVTNITHLFNGMTPLNHRNPGVVGLGLMSDMYCELIADKIHINKELFQFVINSKGKDKLVLITDSMRAGCMPDGEYDLGGQTVYVKDNYARIASGSLAGSVLTLNKAVYNFKENTNLNIYEAINLASLNPAKSIKVDYKKGSLEIGKDADIAIFNENMDCLATIVEGDTIYNKIN